MKRILVVLICFVMAFALLGCGGGGGGRARRGQSEDVINIRASTIQLPGQQMGIGLRLMEENLEKELGDRVNFLGYDSATLYSSPADLEALSRGEIQFVFAIGGMMETISSLLQVARLPWLFPNANTAYRFMETSETARRIFAPLENAGLMVTGLFSSGNTIFTNSIKPLVVPADFVGMKIRTPGTMDTLSLDALGANALVTPSEEMYSMIQNAVIDGLMIPSAVFVPRRLFEVQRYMTHPGFMVFQVGYLVTNLEWYNGLPADFRAGLDRAINATVTQMRINVEEEEARIYERAVNEGTEVHYLSDDELAQWKQIIPGIYDAVRAMHGADLIDLAVREAASM